MATTLDIDEVMLSNPATKHYYGGTWGLDEAVAMMTEINNVGVCYVVNSCPSNHLGSHWTAVWFGDEGRAEHFCSYGLPPPIELHTALGGKYKRSCIQLQHVDSELCGYYYCMLYLMCKCRGFNMEEYLNCFTEYPTMNDKIVRLVWNCVK